jgi:histidinol-phosphate/aromatic aminotransferase/cobyric acid decarboxylase-like protein
VHGGLDEQELRALGISAGDVIDFSVNLNPYGPCQPLLDALRAAPLDVYPDPLARRAREAWASVLETSFERIAVGHGAADLFWATARALLRPGARVVIAEPTFSEFRVAAAALGARIDPHWAREEQGFRHDLTALAARAQGAAALYLCSPNNPTGVHVPVDEVAALARALPTTWLVLDQSFLALSEHAHEAQAALPDNVVCVRSLTKDFALAGLRIGLLVAARHVVGAIEAMRPTWSTSAPAQAAIAAAAREHGFVRASYERLRQDRVQLAQLLREQGLPPLPSSSVFQLLRVGQAAHFRARLLPLGIALRDCSSFGLPHHVRIAVRPARELALLRAALIAACRQGAS